MPTTRKRSRAEVPSPDRGQRKANIPGKTSGSKGTSEQSVANFVLSAAPGHLLRRNHQRSYEIFQKHVGDGITRQQYALLLALAQNPGMSQNELVEATGLDKSTLKEMLGRLVEKDWVSREKDPNDSRAWTMKTTAAGKKILTNHIDAVEAAQREILQPLTPSEQEQFIRFLRKLLSSNPGLQ